MRETASSLLILAVTMNFLALGSSNLKACIQAAALQGFFVRPNCDCCRGATPRSRSRSSSRRT